MLIAIVGDVEVAHDGCFEHHSIPRLALIEPGDPLFEKLVEAVQSYLSKRPNAKDTLKGIHGWWLPKELNCTQEELQAVLDHMVSTGTLERIVNTSGGAIYRRNFLNG